MDCYLVVKKPGENAVLVDSSRGFEIVKEVVGYATLVRSGDILLAVDDDALLKYATPNVRHPKMGVLYNTLVATVSDDPHFEGINKDLAESVAIGVDSLSIP